MPDINDNSPFDNAIWKFESVIREFVKSGDLLNIEDLNHFQQIIEEGYARTMGDIAEQFKAASDAASGVAQDLKKMEQLNTLRQNLCLATGMIAGYKIALLSIAEEEDPLNIEQLEAEENKLREQYWIEEGPELLTKEEDKKYLTKLGMIEGQRVVAEAYYEGPKDPTVVSILDHLRKDS